MKLASLCAATVLAFTTGAFAQTSTEPATPAPDPAAPMAPDTSATKTSPSEESLEPGANSFTEAQAKDWLEEAGYTDVGGLVQSEDGIWRGHARLNGKDVNVAVDYKGTISAD